jgi:hypothetical protein
MLGDELRRRLISRIRFLPPLSWTPGLALGKLRWPTWLRLRIKELKKSGFAGPRNPESTTVGADDFTETKFELKVFNKRKIMYVTNR